CRVMQCCQLVGHVCGVSVGAEVSPARRAMAIFHIEPVMASLAPIHCNAGLVDMQNRVYALRQPWYAPISVPCVFEVQMLEMACTLGDCCFGSVPFPACTRKKTRQSPPCFQLYPLRRPPPRSARRDKAPECPCLLFWPRRAWLALS